MKKIYLLPVIFLPLTACSTNAPYVGPTNEQIMEQNSMILSVNKRIEDSFVSTEQAVKELVEIKKASSKIELPVLDESQYPVEMRKKVSLKYDGPAVNAAKEIARLMGYSFTEQGNKTHESFIQVYETDVSLASLVAGIGRQVYPYEKIQVDPNNMKITYIYTPSTNKLPGPAPAKGQRRTGNLNNEVSK